MSESFPSTIPFYFRQLKTGFYSLITWLKLKFIVALVVLLLFKNSVKKIVSKFFMYVWLYLAKPWNVYLTLLEVTIFNSRSNSLFVFFGFTLGINFGICCDSISNLQILHYTTEYRFIVAVKVPKERSNIFAEIYWLQRFSTSKSNLRKKILWNRNLQLNLFLSVFFHQFPTLLWSPKWLICQNRFLLLFHFISDNQKLDFTALLQD